ncbi:MAG TPA: hypothetical protein VLD61_08235, partial [Methylomirabilota bacterium]|nr:hypothetical protein [Methylomirabilota bacterium]
RRPSAKVDASADHAVPSRVAHSPGMRAGRPPAVVEYRMLLTKLVLGLATLILGRQLYWLFVGVVGFLAGFELGGWVLHDRSGWVVLALGVILGLAGALVAVFFQYVAVGAAGFLVGSLVTLRLLGQTEVPTETGVRLVALVVGALAAVLVILALDWALIVLSSLAGAALVTDALTPGRTLGPLLFLALAAAGVIVQASVLRRRSSPPGPPRHD